MARSEPRNWLPGWAGRTQVERVELYTRASLFVIFWLLVALAALGAGNLTESAPAIVGILVGALALGVSGTLLLRRAMDLYPDEAPLPRTELAALLGLSALAQGLVFLLPEDARFSAAIMIVGALTLGAGGLRDRRVLWFLYVASPIIMLISTGMIGLAAYGLAMGLFLIFTVQSSMWLLGVVNELDTARGSQAALAVAEERLRFSRDVHDVLGRRLSTIAVQAELAATLSERGDPQAPERMLQVRVTAHEALREARELARGYRPLALDTEVDGAISLLRSAGITATADLGDLPESWHEPVARVIRESVTNVLRHSRATRVTMTYADGEVVIRNDGVTGSAEDSQGTGLTTLQEHLEPLGARLETRRIDDEFVVKVCLVAEPARAEGSR